MATRVVAEVETSFGDPWQGGQSAWEQTGTASVNGRGEWRVKLVHKDTGQNYGHNDTSTVGLGDSYREARDAALANSEESDKEHGTWRALVAKLDDEVYEADEDEDEDDEDVNGQS